MIWLMLKLFFMTKTKQTKKKKDLKDVEKLKWNLNQN